MTKKSPQRQANAIHPTRNRKRFGIILMLLTTVGLVAFACRFAYVALGGKVDSANLSQYRQKVIAQKTVLKAKRGTIYDRSGNVIAEDSNTYTVYAVLDQNYVDGKKKLYVTDKAKTAKVLAKYLPLSEAKILALLNPKSKKTFQVEFGSAGTGLSLATKQQIQAENLSGINFTDSPSRLYPNGVFASHVVGLAQPQNNAKSTDQLVGVMGLEKQFNNVLKGSNGYRTSQTDAYGYQLPDSQVKAKAAVNGGAVTTTIDSSLQSYLETLMTSVATKYQPKSLSAVLENPQTGEILAASQRPTFDPSTGEGLGNMWRDILVEDNYEPGSVMKIFTLAAAIQSGKYYPNSYYKSGTVKVADTTIKDWNTTGWGTIPLSQAFPRSSNVGMVKIEQSMGATVFSEYLRKFGFGQQTGVALPGETSGTFDFGSYLDSAMASFGQSIDVNTMQLMQAVSAVANDGTMVKPRLVEKITDKQGKTTTYKRQVVSKPISKATADQVTEAMRQVVTASYGTGAAYKMNGVDLAVKTGTAQIAGASGNGYLTGDSNYVFSVMGMAPASHPKYVLYIAMKQPQKMTAPAESIMAEIFKPMMARALALDGTSDTAANDSEVASVPNVTNTALATGQQKLQNAGFAVATIGTGNQIVQQLPTAGGSALKGARVLVLTNGAMTMPDVSGWSKGDVLKLAQLTGKKFSLKGSGYATQQSLKAGSLLGDDQVVIQFKQK
ncbi:MAG: penicillin-binding protein [Lactobacillus sp.]|jgi:penicillin-binding protein 2B|nr:penicillin-binding protein [Lactobacillus sp.]MCI2032597.1 penicillin-binding protein [Lactobacillus sp.]